MNAIPKNIAFVTVSYLLLLVGCNHTVSSSTPLQKLLFNNPRLSYRELTPLDISKTASAKVEPVVTASPAQPLADPLLVTQRQNSSAINVGFLEQARTLNGSLNSPGEEKYYRFRIGNPSNVSLYLNGVTNEVTISLYKDRNSNGIVDESYSYRESAFNSKAGIISKVLSVGDYFVGVRLKGNNTNYSLQLVNHTTEMVNIGFLEETRSFNGSISSSNQIKVYRFSLGNPSNISLSLEGVASEVAISLYKDRNSNGVVDESYSYRDLASNSKAGIIRKLLKTGDYFVVVGLEAKDTNYTLTISNR